MSRGGSFGGGQSSLGYLFADPADERSKKQANDPPPPASLPPYGIDTIPEKSSLPPPPTIKDEDQKSPFNNYHRADGQNSGNFLTGRPSTKVNSVPGGDSSLGYLFGDK